MVRLVVLGLVLLLGVNGAQGAADVPPEQAYEQLYGSEAKSVRSATDRSAFPAFAKKLLEGARAVKDDATLQALLYNRAYEFGMAHPDGYETAIQAMQGLTTDQPAQKEAADARIIVAMERRWQTCKLSQKKETVTSYYFKLIELGDAKEQSGHPDDAVSIYHKAIVPAATLGSEEMGAVQLRITQANALSSDLKRLVMLKKRLAADPKDSAGAAELAVLLAVDLCKPDDALKYLPGVSDQAVKREIALAAKPPDQLNEKEAFELANWYESHLSDASPLGRSEAASKAKKCYECFLGKHTTEDAERLKATLAVERLAKTASRGSARVQSTSPPRDQAVRISGPADREIATKLLQLGGIVGLQVGNNQIECHRVEELPPGPFLLIVANLSENQVLEDRDLAILRGCASIRTLHLDGTHVSDLALREVATLPNLEYLDLNQTAITDQGFRFISGLQNLTALKISNTRITDAGLIAVGKLTSLKELRIGGNHRITDKGLAGIINLTNLERLALSYTPCTDACVPMLSRMTKLRTLYLTGTSISDTAVRHVLPQCEPSR